MVTLCGGGGGGGRLRSAISRTVRFVLRRCGCGYGGGCCTYQGTLLFSTTGKDTGGSTGHLLTVCRLIFGRRRLSRIAMPTGAAASLLLLLTIMSQSQAPQQDHLGDFHPRRTPALGKSGQLPPEVVPYRHYEELPKDKMVRKIDEWDHPRKIRRAESKYKEKDKIGGKFPAYFLPNNLLRQFRRRQTESKREKTKTEFGLKKH